MVSFIGIHSKPSEQSDSPNWESLHAVTFSRRCGTVTANDERIKFVIIFRLRIRFSPQTASPPPLIFSEKRNVTFCYIFNVTYCYNEVKRMQLKELRKKRNLNQQRVAVDLDISREALSYYENGKREPDLQMLIKMSEYFNVSIDYLITGREFKKK